MTRDYTQAENASHLQRKYWQNSHIKNHYKRIRM